METIIGKKLKVEFIWEKDRLSAIELTWAGPGDESAIRTRQAEAFRDALLWLEAKEPVAWPRLPLAWDRVTPFAGHVLRTLAAKVGFGHTVSYGRLAAMCGKPGAARAVGRAMSRNPWPLVVPCHRVIGADGSLTGFGCGLDIKKYLLELEGAI